MKKTLMTLAVAMLIALTGCAQGTQVTEAELQQGQEENWPEAVVIDLSDERILVDGAQISDNAESAVYAAHDIIYYEQGKDHTYGEGTQEEAHSAEQAQAHTVVHITRPGQYALRGKLSAGQIAVDLGDEAKEDPDAVVTLVLDNVDITCTVAPAVIFYNVYECGSTDTETVGMEVDTRGAGANVVIADGTSNQVNGSYVARIYKPESVQLSEDGTTVEEAKKLHKYDGAFYSKMSLNIDGEELGDGILNINAENEGLDSELHLTINSGEVNIRSGNDGINTNEDGVSVTTVNGGTLNITVTGTTGEGDGIDSNGWLVINGGTVVAAACGDSMDAGIDSDMGIHINGGTVVASGNMLDHIAEQKQNYAVFQFGGKISSGEKIVLKNESGEEIKSFQPENDYSCLLYSAPELTEGVYTLWQGETQLGHGGQQGGMMGGPRPGGMEKPDGVERPERQEPPEGMEMPADRKPFEFQPNEDGTVTLPDGTVVDPEEMMPPHREFGEFGGKETPQATQERFEMKTGANLFYGVGELKSN